MTSVFILNSDSVALRWGSRCLREDHRNTRGCRHCEELQAQRVVSTGHSRGAAWRGFGYQQARLLGFPGSSVGKESAFNAGDWGSIPGSGIYPGGGHGNSLQYSCLENHHAQRSLACYSPWGRKESVMTEQLSTQVIYQHYIASSSHCPVNWAG